MAAAPGPPQLLSASPRTFLSSWIVALSRQAGGTLIGGYTGKYAEYDCSASAAELRPRPRLRPITYVRTYVFLIRCLIAYTGSASASASAIRTYAIRMYRRTYVRVLPFVAFDCLHGFCLKSFPQKFGRRKRRIFSAISTYVCTYIHVIRSRRTATGNPAFKTSLPTPIEKRHRQMSKQEFEGILVLD